MRSVERQLDSGAREKKNTLHPLLLKWNVNCLSAAALWRAGKAHVLQAPKRT